MQPGAVGWASRNPLDGQRVEPQLEDVLLGALMRLPRRDGIGLIVYDHQFPALLEPQVHLPAYHHLLYRHQEIELALDPARPRQAAPERALAEDRSQSQRLRIRVGDIGSGEQLVDLSAELGCGQATLFGDGFEFADTRFEAEIVAKVVFSGAISELGQRSHSGIGIVLVVDFRRRKEFQHGAGWDWPERSIPFSGGRVEDLPYCDQQAQVPGFAVGGRKGDDFVAWDIQVQMQAVGYHRGPVGELSAVAGEAQDEVL